MYAAGMGMVGFIGQIHPLTDNVKWQKPQNNQKILETDNQT